MAGWEQCQGMKILLLCDAGSNQRALAHKIAQQVPLAGIVVVTAPQRKERTPARRIRSSLNRIALFAAGLPLRKAWFSMLSQYAAKYPRFPEVPISEVADINSEDVIRLHDEVEPDLVLVSGTNLLKASLIAKIQEHGKVLNLHTGISPYIKGAPNCTNWCLALRRFDLIGNTIMWLDAGIDSGNLVATERTPLTGAESLQELHFAVMEHAHSLYLRCISLLTQGQELPNVPQVRLGEGSLFLSKQWTAGKAARAVANFYLHYKAEARRPAREGLLLVSATSGPVQMA